ncbi:MAG TPA: chemotaxis protein CheW [Thermoanaerobaculia bacterium]|nr:chemotaxis protein CheW [Thermoanaerobaculia bacterium]
MVNLAKLRKKAKEKKEKKATGSDDPALGPPSPEPRAHPPPPRAESRIAEYLATAGESRSDAAQAEEERPADQIELLTFVLAGEQYAIDIEQVVEIITPRPVTRVPNADPSVVGILSLRGAVVTLIDARGRLRHGGAGEGGADARVIVVQHDGETAGFLVDRVLRVVKVDRAEIEPHPVVHSSEAGESVRGVFRQGDALTILLDLSKLIFATSEWN